MSEYPKVKDVIQVLHDGHKGFAEIGEHLKDAEIKEFFMSESKVRQRFATELEVAIGSDLNTGGTVSGSIHRAWGDLKAHLGGGDHTLLETAEQGEDAAKKAYREVIDDAETPAPIRELLLKQDQHIKASHDRVKAWRDATK